MLRMHTLALQAWDGLVRALSAWVEVLSQPPATRVRESFGLNSLAPTPRPAEAGMATAEYAIATIAAVGFAGLLIVILKSELVRGFLERIFTRALSVD